VKQNFIPPEHHIVRYVGGTHIDKDSEENPVSRSRESDATGFPQVPALWAGVRHISSNARAARFDIRLASASASAASCAAANASLLYGLVIALQLDHHFCRSGSATPTTTAIFGALRKAMHNTHPDPGCD